MAVGLSSAALRDRPRKAKDYRLTAMSIQIDIVSLLTADVVHRRLIV